MRYSSVNSNRSRSCCAKVISVLSFSSALLIWSCSSCQPASSSTGYNFQCCGLQQAGPLPFPSSTLGNCLHQDPYQQGCPHPFAELWGWQESLCSSFAGTHELMLTTFQGHLPNHGKLVATIGVVPNMPCLGGFVSCQHGHLGDGVQAKRV